MVMPLLVELFKVVEGRGRVRRLRGRRLVGRRRLGLLPGERRDGVLQLLELGHRAGDRRAHLGAKADHLRREAHVLILEAGQLGVDAADLDVGILEVGLDVLDVALQVDHRQRDLVVGRVVGRVVELVLHREDVFGRCGCLDRRELHRPDVLELQHLARLVDDRHRRDVRALGEHGIGLLDDLDGRRGQLRLPVGRLVPFGTWSTKNTELPV